MIFWCSLPTWAVLWFDGSVFAAVCMLLRVVIPVCLKDWQVWLHPYRQERCRWSNISPKRQKRVDLMSIVQVGDSSRWKSKLRGRKAFVYARGGRGLWGRLKHLPHSLHYLKGINSSQVTTFFFSMIEWKWTGIYIYTCLSFALFWSVHFAYTMNDYIVQNRVHTDTIYCALWKLIFFHFLSQNKHSCWWTPAWLSGSGNIGCCWRLVTGRLGCGSG